MEKKKICHVMQLMAFFLFIAMALACASQKSMVDSINGEAGSRGSNSSSSNEGASIETTTDSISVLYDLALN